MRDNTVTYVNWVSVACRLVLITVMMGSPQPPCSATLGVLQGPFRLVTEDLGAYGFLILVVPAPRLSLLVLVFCLIK